MLNKKMPFSSYKNVTIRGSNSWCGNNGKRIVSAGDDITITYSDAASGSPNATSSIGGQFPSLVLQTI